MKRILASVFLVLAVVTAVGIFGVQTSNQSEAAIAEDTTVQGGGGVQNHSIVLGESHTIDLSKYLIFSGNSTATNTNFYLLAATVSNNRDVYDPDAADQTGTNEPSWDTDIIQLDLTGHMLKVTAGGAASTVGQNTTIFWAADDPTVGTFDPMVAGGTGATADYTDWFTVTVRAAITDAGLADPDGPDVPAQTAMTSDDPPVSVWKGTAASAGTTAGFAGTAFVVNVEDLPAHQEYRLEVTSSVPGVATPVVQGAHGDPARGIEITPRGAGTTVLTIKITHAFGFDVNDDWEWERTVTITPSLVAPPIEIYYDVDDNGKDSDDPRGDSASDPITLTVTSDQEGKFAELNTDSNDDPNYLNRNVRWRLADTNGANVIANFRMSTGDIKRTDNPDDGASAQTSVGELKVAPGANLTVGESYTMTVIAQDHVAEDDGPPEVEAGKSDSATVTVRVVQGNRAPVLQDLPTITILETDSPDANAHDVGDSLIDLNDYVSDADSNEITFRIAVVDDNDPDTPAQSLGRGGVTKFELDGSDINLAAAVDYEDVDEDGDEDTAAEMAEDDYDADAIRWTFTVFASDGIEEVSKTISFKVSDEEDEAPPATGVEFDINENNTVGAADSILGTVRIPSATTAGAADATSGYELVGETGPFSLSGSGVLTATAVLDHEDQDTYRLTATVNDSLALVRSVTVTVNDLNEAPMFNKPGATAAATPVPLDDDVATDVYVARVSESADVGDAVAYGFRTDTPPLDATFAVSRSATDPDDGDVLSYSLIAADSAGAISSTDAAFSGPFTINASTGAITVSGRLDAEAPGGDEYVLYVKAQDDDSTPLDDDVKLTITVLGENEPPYFVTGPNSTTPLVDVAPIAINENTASGTQVARYYAVDPDGDDITFVLRAARDSDFFTINEETGELTVAAGRTLDYESKASYELELEVIDNQAGQGQILQVINLNNLNDNSPVWQQTHTALSVNENALRGSALSGAGGVTSTYTATDADGDAITYSLSGPNGGSYQIGSSTGMLTTLASLDADTNPTDSIVVTASDGVNNITQDTRITINDLNDRIGSITVMMANPVLGTNGDPNSALADRKRTVALAAPEAPSDLPATSGDSVVNFVETAAANWGSTLRIEVLSESPDANCGNGNQCVVLELEGVDSDDILKVMAYRNSLTDNKFVAAVMPVASSNAATPGTAAVYRHTDGSVPRIKVDEEDTLRVKFGNLRDEITIDNEAPEFANFLPEHEASTDDDEVDYTFTVTDAISGIPEPEDLPDADGDDAYMAVAALVNSQQCHNVAAGATAPSGTSMVANTNLHEDAQIYCPTGTTPEVRVIVDDKDLDSVTDGYDVDTKVVLSENEISYVTFIVCDAAGNCTAFDPDENDIGEALAEITVDTADPTLSEARTGVMWDAADNAYDDSRSFIQAIFNDLSKLNPDTIEADDFVVDGYTIRRVYWYDDPDDEDENWGTRYDTGSKSRTYRAISKTVFIELEEELLPDATPDVSIVPNGLEDEAGNEQDDDEVEADDWIAPKFVVTDISSPRTTARDNVLVGEDEKAVLTVTSDERISTTKPLVDVNYVNAPAGCVDRSGIILRAGRDTDGDGRVEPSEARNDCAVSAKGSPLNSVIAKDATNEWTITVDKPSSTGYYNVYIYADDRSSQNNRGSEGVAPDKIVTDFFEKDGDVNSDDAVYFEGDVQLPKPQVVVSGEQAGDTEPTVEFKRPLFIEIDFTEPFSADCSDADKLGNKIECISESAEYAEDGFDAVTITRFELNGVDMTDDVRTTDDETFLVALNDVSIGDHEIKIQATDVAGNELKDVLEIEFEVEERDPFTRRLNPGWNLVSLPGSPEESAIASVFGSDIEVRTVYTYNPVTPGGWQVAVRETLDDAWQGDLTDITAKSGYWVLSDAIQDLEVSIPRLAGGAVGASTPVQPPVIPMYAGWNLIPVVDVTGDALDTDKAIDATTYLNSLDDGLDLARVLGFNTITNEWFTVIDPSDTSVTDDLQIGSAYWVFVRESASLVPGGIPR